MGCILFKGPKEGSKHEAGKRGTVYSIHGHTYNTPLQDKVRVLEPKVQGGDSVDEEWGTRTGRSGSG